MNATVDRQRLRFEEAVAALEQRLQLRGTASYRDLGPDEHARAFAVAGAMKADLLADLREAVQRAVEAGITLDEFRKDFWAAVRVHGWHGWTGEGTDGGEAWRTRVIYTTNIRKSYSAGRYAQLTDPDFVPSIRFGNGCTAAWPWTRARNTRPGMAWCCGTMTRFGSRTFRRAFRLTMAARAA